MEVDGRSVTTLVLLGKKGTQPLFGAYSLEGLGLSVDSRRRRLVPIPAGGCGALDYRIRMLPLRSVPPSVGAGGG